MSNNGYFLAKDDDFFKSDHSLRFPDCVPKKFWKAEDISSLAFSYLNHVLVCSTRTVTKSGTGLTVNCSTAALSVPAQSIVTTSD